MIVGTSCMIAFQHAGQAAGLALEMKAQRELVHVLEGAIGEPAHRVHRDLGEDAVARLREHRHEDAHPAVGNGERDRSRERPDEPCGGQDRRTPLPGERVGRPFEGERHDDGGKLGGEQQRHRRGDAQLEIAAVRRPDVRPQPAHDREQRGLALGEDLALQRLARTRMRLHSRTPAGSDGPHAQPCRTTSHIEAFADHSTPKGKIQPSGIEPPRVSRGLHPRVMSQQFFKQGGLPSIGARSRALTACAGRATSFAHEHN
jgi:hypothetical protein